MKKYKVHLSRTLSADVEIEAETADEAEEIAFYRLDRTCEIVLEDSGIPGDVNIKVIEIPAKEAEK